LQLEFSKQSLCHFWLRTKKECLVISDLATHNSFGFAQHICVKRHSLKIESHQVQNRSFLKNVENVLRRALSCINLRMDDLLESVLTVVREGRVLS